MDLHVINRSHPFTAGRALPGPGRPAAQEACQTTSQPETDSDSQEMGTQSAARMAASATDCRRFAPEGSRTPTGRSPSSQPPAGHRPDASFYSTTKQGGKLARDGDSKTMMERHPTRPTRPQRSTKASRVWRSPEGEAAHKHPAGRVGRSGVSRGTPGKGGRPARSERAELVRVLGAAVGNRATKQWHYVVG